MSTSDGISTEDWDVVHELAVDVVNASDDQEAHCRRRLLDWLDRLESRYGPLASILATRADYLEDGDPAREELLLRAHSLAESREDHANLLHVAHSLAEMYLAKNDLAEADRWLARMRAHLTAINSSEFTEEYKTLRAAYRRLAINRIISPR